MVAEVTVAALILRIGCIAANPLINAGKQVLDLPEYIQWIETNMRALQSYLKDAESKKATSHEAANLIIAISDLALDVEDILDKYLPDFESHNASGLMECLKQYSCILCYWSTQWKFTSEVKAVERRAAEIERARVNSAIIAAHIGGEGTDVKTVWDRRKLFLIEKESKIFGREEILQRLEVKLLCADVQCKIISLIGPAGVGKTTVGKKIYKTIENEFQCSAIVYVSKEPKLGELLIDIARQVKLSEDKIKENLEENLCTWLGQKRYVIYLDDIWNSSTWDRLKQVFPVNSETRSRIIVTSRYDGVGRYIGGHRSLVKLDHLSKNEGWELFCDLISRHYEEPLQPALVDIGGKIVDKCGGLPLAIVVAVGMLKHRKRTPYEWNGVLEGMRVRDSEVLERMRDSAGDGFLEILALSFQDLPAELKPFFLYFGLFPEDCEIFVSDLAEAWIAEKFIPVNDHARNPEHVAESKLYRLMDRNLIQVSRRRSDGRIKSCRIHDVLRDLCITLAKEHNFFHVLDNLESSPSPGFASTGRRITTHDSKYIEGFRPPPKLRSLFCFNQDEKLFKSLKRNSLNMSFLRLLVIEVEGNRSISLPKEIANLSCLSYLKLIGFDFYIPSCISSLSNLATLYIICATGATGAILPWSIFNMKHLKHLLLDCNFSIRKPSLKCKCDVDLPNLESLYLLHLEDLPPRLFKKLPKLKKLGVRYLRSQILEDLYFTDRLSGMLEVLRLQLYNFFVEGDKYFEGTWKINLSHLQHLVKLRLDLANFYTPCNNLVQFPSNLVHITLRGVIITNTWMESLRTLPKLEFLKLKVCEAATTVDSSEPIGLLDFSGENSFSQLQCLVISESDILELKVDEQGLPKLDRIIFRPGYPIFPLKFPERLGAIMVIED